MSTPFSSLVIFSQISIFYLSWFLALHSYNLWYYFISSESLGILTLFYYDSLIYWSLKLPLMVNCFGVSFYLAYSTSFLDRIDSIYEPTLHWPCIIIYKPFGTSPSLRMNSPSEYFLYVIELARGRIIYISWSLKISRFFKNFTFR